MYLYLHVYYDLIQLVHQLLQDLQHKIKEHFRGTPDEFMTNENALQAKVLWYYDSVQLSLSNCREFRTTVQEKVIVIVKSHFFVEKEIMIALSSMCFPPRVVIVHVPHIWRQMSFLRPGVVKQQQKLKTLTPHIWQHKVP